MEPRGLVLVTGPTGSGKTTTLAGMIDHINNNREVHVVTIEDPIEVLHFDKLSMINQREVRLDTDDFAIALRAAMRQDPDVILVGEMRDHETVKAALAASETGHFVMSTLHTTDAQETITRVIDFFPPHEQKQVRLSLAGALRGIVCQRLVPRADGQGRCVAMEICVNDRPDRRRDRRPRQDQHDRGADQGGCVLRHADLRPAPRRADPGRRHHPGGRDGSLDQPARPHRRAASPGPRRLSAAPLARRLPSVVSPGPYAVLDAAGGPAAREHLHHHPPPAVPAVAGRLELAAVGARAVVARRGVAALVAPGSFVQHGP